MIDSMTVRLFSMATNLIVSSLDFDINPPNGISDSENALSILTSDWFEGGMRTAYAIYVFGNSNENIALKIDT